MRVVRIFGGKNNILGKIKFFQIGFYLFYGLAFFLFGILWVWESFGVWFSKQISLGFLINRIRQSLGNFIDFQICLDAVFRGSRLGLRSLYRYIEGRVIQGLDGSGSFFRVIIWFFRLFYSVFYVVSVYNGKLVVQVCVSVVQCQES